MCGSFTHLNTSEISVKSPEMMCGKSEKYATIDEVIFCKI
jgi:hypothetical protein